ncbi:CBS domain-containing protein [Paenibacillus guangzhouensis]|uniref:CBS domain-containing protein n=1 Tax=Paenibacillus guangzhouensis TaxID=1473112 RepID=UPI0012670F15|nr:CBS domain-containing protein [Paenibacillus guangzhouensis]
MKTLREIMTTNCETVTPDENIYQIAVMMEQNDIGFVPVVRGDRLIGVVTDRDLAVRGYATKRPGSTPAEEVMTKDIVTASPDMSVDEAAELMSREMIRRLAVVEDGRLVGVVAIGDLAMQDQFQHMASSALRDISEHTDVPHH